MITGLEHYKAKWNIQSDRSIKPGLDAMTEALGELGNPHHKQQYIHIAGTNGKGSTAAMITAILMQHGKRVGNFFSPAIEDVHDQIQIDRQPVSAADFDQAMEKLSKITTALTDFELLTAVAFLIFQDQEPDYVIIEAGMGGRFDSTNVIDPLIAVIPSISLEHTNFLGDTIEEIAWHKAGIIKKGRPVTIGKLPAAAETVVRAIAQQTGSKVLKPQRAFEGPLALKGKHQHDNAALAISAAKQVLGAQFNESLATSGVSSATIPFRFEEVLPGVICDGAHNVASIEALIRTVKEYYPDRDIHIVMGLLKDKDYVSILRKLESIGSRFTFLDFEDDRAMEAKILFSENKSKIKTIRNLCDILPVYSEKEATIVTGSLYLLAILRKQNYSMFELDKRD